MPALPAPPNKKRKKKKALPDILGHKVNTGKTSNISEKIG